MFEGRNKEPGTILFCNCEPVISNQGKIFCYNRKRVQGYKQGLSGYYHQNNLIDIVLVFRQFGSSDISWQFQQGKMSQRQGWLEI